MGLACAHDQLSIQTLQVNTLTAHGNIPTLHAIIQHGCTSAGLSNIASPDSAFKVIGHEARAEKTLLHRA